MLLSQSGQLGRVVFLGLRTSTHIFVKNPGDAACHLLHEVLLHLTSLTIRILQIPVSAQSAQSLPRLSDSNNTK
jgi:hypothetical protein